MIGGNEKISQKAGLPPGTLIHIGERKTDKVRMRLITYNDEVFEEYDIEDINSVNFDDPKKVYWVNVNGLHDLELIERIGAKLQLNALMLEDVLNTRHRPKFEEYENCLFLTLKMIGINKNRTKTIVEQVSLLMGKNWLITFQEREGDIFDTIRNRLGESKGIIRQRGVDYLYYCLIDAVVDGYFYVMEFLSDQVESIEERVIRFSEDDHLTEIRNIRRLLVKYRRYVVPLRDAVAAMLKEKVVFLDEKFDPYLRDDYDHLIYLSENIEAQRELIGSVMDLHLSGVSNRMNQVMKTLTIISTLFIPLTFIVGVYGMNFEYMPELKMRYAYFVVWAIMLVLVIMMLRFFRKMKWL